MSILCRLKKHSAVPSLLWNAGFYFSKCARCECDLIRRGDHWTEVPKGYQVIWKQQRGGPIDWTPWSARDQRLSPRITELVGVSGFAGATPDAELVVDQRDDPFRGNSLAWTRSADPAPQRRVA